MGLPIDLHDSNTANSNNHFADESSDHLKAFRRDTIQVRFAAAATKRRTHFVSDISVKAAFFQSGEEGVKIDETIA
jgi:hypothetical protein